MDRHLEGVKDPARTVAQVVPHGVVGPDRTAGDECQVLAKITAICQVFLKQLTSEAPRPSR